MNMLSFIQKLPIKWKITALSFGIVAFSLVMLGIVLLGYASDMKEDELRQQAIVSGQTVAQDADVQQALSTGADRDVVQRIAEQTRMINDNDYIVVLNMNRVRLSHPITQRIGTLYVEDDADAAFSEHLYTNKASHESGVTVRSFVPVIDDDREQVGVVVAGNVLPTLWELMYDFRHAAYLVALMIAVFGAWGSWMLAHHIKKQTFDMEPEELARVLMERKATFNAIHEGVIAIDGAERITVANEVAREMLNIQGNPEGKKVHHVLPDTRLPEIVQHEEAVYQKEIYIQNRLVLSNRIPIKMNGKTAGAVAIFQDKSEVDHLARELTGVQSFVDALRVQNHEYSNKMHTIAGLIQMDESKKALDYIFEVTSEENERTHLLKQRIHDDSITGLLLGKMNRGKELGYEVVLDSRCFFEQCPEGMTTHDVAVILGNLIDNSFDALESVERDDQRVNVLLFQDEYELVIEVSDTGSGIPEKVRNCLFERGVTTKGSEKERGIGMFLIQSIVERIDGHVEVHSELYEGTEITVVLPMGRGGYHEQSSIS
ncbi:two-component system sensor histidine kinase DctS [Salsuginibacillus halophilus]|uniref:histidine kinase n=1 Tax=Salsuginibacillus halophilus TaxID=517424 RepID=A0A2P8HLB0_9BACI|nr:two-component system sensor histidine kinase DctS [Salsuginibacillus halophilus]